MARRRSKRRHIQSRGGKQPVLRLKLRTNDGAPLFPNHLHNVQQIVARANWLLDSRQVTRFRHPEFNLSRDYDGGIMISLIYDEGKKLVLEERSGFGRLQTVFVHKEHLVECLDLLKRELVLDDLSDI